MFTFALHHPSRLYHTSSWCIHLLLGFFWYSNIYFLSLTIWKINWVDSWDQEFFSYETFRNRSFLSHWLHVCKFFAALALVCLVFHSIHWVSLEYLLQWCARLTNREICYDQEFAEERKSWTWSLKTKSFPLTEGICDILAKRTVWG